jgi:uncharacterized protein
LSNRREFLVYLDSNVFVYAVTHDPTKYVKARRAIAVLRDVEEDTTKAATSFLTWDELVWVVWKLKGREAGIRAGSAILKLENLSLSAVNSSVMLRSQEILEKYPLKPRDSIHVATALLTGEKEVVSDDSDLDVVREITRHSLD